MSGAGLASMALRFTALLVFLLGAALLFAADTATFRGNPAHTGVYDAAGVPTLHGVKWTFKTAGKIIGTPAIHNEALYVGSSGGILYAIDRATGAVKWQFDAKVRIASSPAVDGGLVYFGACDGNFYALAEETGQLKWKFKTCGEHRFSAKHLHGSQPATETMPDPLDCYLSSPVVWNGAVYFGSGDGNMYALEAATGALKWKFKTGDVVHASPAIADGTLFIGSWDSNFYALDAATGEEKWRFKTGEDPDTHNQQGIQSSAAVADGMVYFGCRDAHLYALDEQTGKMKWSYSTKGSWVIASPAVEGARSTSPRPTPACSMRPTRRTGDILFSVSFNGWPLFSSPAIAGDTVVRGFDRGNAERRGPRIARCSLDLRDRRPKSNTALFRPDGNPNYEAVYPSDFYDDMMAGYIKLQAVGPILASPVVVDNVVYVGSVDGNLYALN